MYYICTININQLKNQIMKKSYAIYVIYIISMTSALAVHWSEINY